MRERGADRDVNRSRHPQAPRVRVRSLSRSIAAIGELVDGLGVAGPLPRPGEGEAEGEASSALVRTIGL
jgi:hypothetical protein